MVRFGWRRYESAHQTNLGYYINFVAKTFAIQAYGIYHKVFESWKGNKRITTNVYEIKISPENAPILKRILYKTS